VGRSVKMGTARGANRVEGEKDVGDVTEAAVARPTMSRSARLNRLFDQAQRAEGLAVSNAALAAHVKKVTGKPCTEEWIGELRDEHRTLKVKLTTEKLIAIARYFGVDDHFLFEDEAQPWVPRATRLNWLFDHYRPKDGPKIPNKVVAAHVAKVTGQRCREEWIGELRDEFPLRTVRMTAEKLDGIADFFKVSPAYFVDEEQARIIQASMTVMEEYRDAGARGIALRDFAAAFQENASAMSVENLQALAALMRSFGGQVTGQVAQDQAASEEQRRAR
jgi:hypothetical protein